MSQLDYETFKRVYEKGRWQGFRFGLVLGANLGVLATIAISLVLSP